MCLLEILPNGDFHLTKNLLNNAIHQYAILSHTWGDESQEVTFEDIVHQSAKEFLVEKAHSEIFPSGIEYEYHNIFSRSLRIMSEKLKRDIYGLVAPGVTIDQVKQPRCDPLSPARYSCVY